MIERIPFSARSLFLEQRAVPKALRQKFLWIAQFLRGRQARERAFHHCELHSQGLWRLRNKREEMRVEGCGLSKVKFLVSEYVEETKLQQRGKLKR